MEHTNPGASWVASMHCVSWMEPGKALVNLLLLCEHRPKGSIHGDNLQMAGLRTGLVELNLLHQNPQIKFRSLCTIYTDPRKSVELLEIQDTV